jgi:hypothetical protein
MGEHQETRKSATLTESGQGQDSMLTEFKEGIYYFGRLSKVQRWPTVSSAPGRWEVILITFAIYSLLPERLELRDNDRQHASFDVIVGSAIKSLTISHKSLAVAVGVRDCIVADDWLRLDPQRGDRDHWVQLTFKPVQPNEAADYRQMFKQIVPFDPGCYKIVTNSQVRDVRDLVSIRVAAEQLGPPWNYQRLRRRINRWKEQGVLPSKLIEETSGGQTRVYFRYLKTYLKHYPR